jgi:hypothetical protein
MASKGIENRKRQPAAPRQRINHTIIPALIASFPDLRLILEFQGRQNARLAWTPAQS